MPKVNCAVVGCTNNKYRSNKWKNEVCEGHNKKKGECQCNRPFQLYCFPSTLRNNEQRQCWIKNMKRENANKSIWKPKESDRVCSVHFADGVPTNANPDPTLHLGYETTGKNTRRHLFRQPIPCKKRKVLRSTSTSSSYSIESELQHQQPSNCCYSRQCDENISSCSVLSSFSEHSYVKTPSTKDCDICTDKSELINSLVSKVNSLTLQVKKLKHGKQFGMRSSSFTWRSIKTDAKMNFYTGITSIIIFNTIFMLLQPYVSSMFYWKGPIKYRRTFNKVRKIKVLRKKLSQRDEFLLVLMRLRLGILNEDLAD